MTDQSPDRVSPLTLVLSLVAIGAFILAEFVSPGAGPWVIRGVSLAVALWVLWTLRRARIAMTDRLTTDRVALLTLVLSVVAIGGVILAEFLSPGAGPWVIRGVGVAVALWVLWALRRARTA